MERVDKVTDVKENDTLHYVMRSLAILDEIRKQKGANNPWEYELKLVKRTLQWSEVSKGGMPVIRETWRQKGYPLEVHNLASAMIYHELSEDEESFTNIVTKLIETHGLIGQAIRGEVLFQKNLALCELMDQKLLTKEQLEVCLTVLNECIIRAVSESIWEKVGVQTKSVIHALLEGTLTEYTMEERIYKIKPNFNNHMLLKKFEGSVNRLFQNYELWYLESAIREFSDEIMLRLLSDIDFFLQGQKEPVEHLFFKPLADFLYYDYEGKKKVNIYKKRIIEHYYANKTNEHMKLEFVIEKNVLQICFKLTEACEKLIEFCVEAERSGLITYEQSIVLLFDLFHFRRDEFDRLNNEDKYLKTMNVANSTKKDILNFISGNRVMDVGAGGGIMLDLIERCYKDKEIIGTDISANVIEALMERKRKENHSWMVERLNFVTEKARKRYDTIIFSSILHEVYSYTCYEGKLFHIQSVKAALKNAYDSLDPGGRIIIRDGVKTKGKERVIVQFLPEEAIAGRKFLTRYLEDFKGLTDCSHAVKETKLGYEMDVNLAREFLFTYTWGEESYSHEVKEQFGYFTKEEYEQFINDELNASILVCKEYLEPGYEEALQKKIILFTQDGTKRSLMESTCFIVLKKPQ